MFHDVSKGHKCDIRGLPIYTGGQRSHMLSVQLALKENLSTSIFPQPNWVINGVHFYLTNPEQTQDVSGVSN